MDQKLRVAVAGTGLIASRAHIPALIACPRVRITALVDPAESRARELNAKFSLDARVVSSVEEIVDEVDAAVIATPNATHRDIAVMCLDHGVHVLIEKPLATSLEEGEEIVQAAERSGAVAVVGYNLRFVPVVDFMKQLIDEGFFGRLSRWVYQYGARGGWAPYSGYGLGATGGGVLVVSGTHFLDRMLYWFGYPDRVTFRDDASGGPEATCVAGLEFERDGQTLQGEVRLTRMTSIPEAFAMETERGTVVLRGGEAAITLLPTEHPSVETKLQPREHKKAPNPRQAQIDDFVSACLGEQPSKVPASFGLLTQRLTDELYASREPLEFLMS